MLLFAASALFLFSLLLFAAPALFLQLFFLFFFLKSFLLFFALLQVLLHAAFQFRLVLFFFLLLFPSEAFLVPISRFLFPFSFGSFLRRSCFPGIPVLREQPYQHAVFLGIPGQIHDETEDRFLVQVHVASGSQRLSAYHFLPGAQGIQMHPHIIQILSLLYQLIIPFQNLTVFFPEKEQLHLHQNALQAFLFLVRSFVILRFRQQELQAFFQRFMRLYAVHDGLLIRIQGLRDLVGAHVPCQIAEQNAVGLPLMLLFIFLQPLEAGPFVPHPLGVHMLRRGPHYDQSLRGHEGRYDIGLVVLPGRDHRSPGIEYPQAQISQEIVQVRRHIAVFRVVPVFVLFDRQEDIVLDLVPHHAVIFQDPVDLRQFTPVIGAGPAVHVLIKFTADGKFRRVCQIRVQDDGNERAIPVLLVFHAVMAEHQTPVDLGIRSAFGDDLMIEFIRFFVISVALIVLRLMIQRHKLVQLGSLPLAVEFLQGRLGLFRGLLQLIHLPVKLLLAGQQYIGSAAHFFQPLQVLLVNGKAPVVEITDQPLLGLLLHMKVLQQIHDLGLHLQLRDGLILGGQDAVRDPAQHVQLRAGTALILHQRI